MILVLLGTQDKSFVRLIKDVEDCVRRGVIKERVVVQAGYTKYSSDLLDIYDYIDRDEFDKYISEAKYVITHGGVGSIINSLKLHKKVIAVPRLSKYKEHTNDHQLQIIKKFTEDSYILSYEENGLDSCIKNIKKFKPKEFISNNLEFCKYIENYIEKENHKSFLNRIVFW